MKGLYFILLMIIVVGPLLTALWLARKWAMDEAGKDLDEEALGKRDWRKFPVEKRATLVVLFLPAIFFLVGVVLYVLSALTVRS